MKVILQHSHISHLSYLSCVSKNMPSVSTLCQKLLSFGNHTNKRNVSCCYQSTPNGSQAILSIKGLRARGCQSVQFQFLQKIEVNEVKEPGKIKEPYAYGLFFISLKVPEKIQKSASTFLNYILLLKQYFCYFLTS